MAIIYIKLVAQPTQLTQDVLQNMQSNVQCFD